jgi:hypothetical protein
MEKKVYYVQPKIATKIVELQVEHALPVNIIIGECVGNLTSITFEYEKIDYYIMAWLVTKGTQFYTELPTEDFMDDND